MSVSLTVNGTSYNYPQTGDSNWGTDATAWAQAVTAGMLQKAGGAFTLTAEADFGASYGLKSLYFKSRAAAPASAEPVRLGNDEGVAWRDNGDSADKILKVNTSDALEYDGNTLFSSPMTTAGDIVYENSGAQRLAIGSTDQVLSVSGGLPAWAGSAMVNGVDVTNTALSSDFAISVTSPAEDITGLSVTFSAETDEYVLLIGRFSYGIGSGTAGGVQLWYKLDSDSDVSFHGYDGTFGATCNLVTSAVLLGPLSSGSHTVQARVNKGNSNATYIRGGGNNLSDLTAVRFKFFAK
jgi:hypothetical protein